MAIKVFWTSWVLTTWTCKKFPENPFPTWRNLNQLLEPEIGDAWNSTWGGFRTTHGRFWNKILENRKLFFDCNTYRTWKFWVSNFVFSSSNLLTLIVNWSQFQLFWAIAQRVIKIFSLWPPFRYLKLESQMNKKVCMMSFKCLNQEKDVKILKKESFWFLIVTHWKIESWLLASYEG